MEEDNIQPNYHQRDTENELTREAKVTAKTSEELLQDQLNLD
jgi:hypothetical protein